VRPGIKAEEGSETDARAAHGRSRFLVSRADRPAPVDQRACHRGARGSTAGVADRAVHGFVPAGVGDLAHAHAGRDLNVLRGKTFTAHCRFLSAGCVIRVLMKVIPGLYTGLWLATDKYSFPFISVPCLVKQWQMAGTNRDSPNTLIADEVYPVDPKVIQTLRGHRTRSEVASAVVGMTAEQLRNLETKRTKKASGEILERLSTVLGAESSQLLSESHPLRSDLPAGMPLQPLSTQAPESAIGALSLAYSLENHFVKESVFGIERTAFDNLSIIKSVLPESAVSEISAIRFASPDSDPTLPMESTAMRDCRVCIPSSLIGSAVVLEWICKSAEPSLRIEYEPSFSALPLVRKIVGNESPEFIVLPLTVAARYLQDNHAPQYRPIHGLLKGTHSILAADHMAEIGLRGIARRNVNMLLLGRGSGNNFLDRLARAGLLDRDRISTQAVVVDASSRLKESAEALGEGDIVNAFFPMDVAIMESLGAKRIVIPRDSVDASESILFARKDIAGDQRRVVGCKSLIEYACGILTRDKLLIKYTVNQLFKNYNFMRAISLPFATEVN